MSPRIFFSVLVVILLGWLAAFTYASSQYLENPVFLDHYVDKAEQDQIYMQFYYITNKSDRSTVRQVAIGDLMGYPDNFNDPFYDPFHDSTSMEIDYVQRYNHHELRKADIVLDLHGNEKLREKVIVDEVTVYFSDGRIVEADIGGIAIHPKERSVSSVISQKDGLSSNEGVATILGIEENLSIEAIELHMPSDALGKLNLHLLKSEDRKNIRNHIELKENRINGVKGDPFEDMNFPFDLEEGDNLAFSIHNNGSVIYMLDSWMVIEAQDESGDLISYPVHMELHPLLTKEDINALIEQKGGHGG